MRLLVGVYDPDADVVVQDELAADAERERARLVGVGEVQNPRPCRGHQAPGAAQERTGGVPGPVPLDWAIAGTVDDGAGEIDNDPQRLDNSTPDFDIRCDMVASAATSPGCVCRRQAHLGDELRQDVGCTWSAATAGPCSCAWSGASTARG